jgi:hypothetical protein
MGADDPEDKNLAPAAFEDIKELQEVGASGAVSIAVQVDLRLFPPVRFVIDSDGIIQDLQHRRESSAGQPETLTSFLKWAEAKFDAERYLLILWGHGVGIGFELEFATNLADGPFDGEDGLKVRELADVLKGYVKRQQRPIDLVGFDACYMIGIEIVYELRGLAAYLVGPQSSLPFGGWPYTPVIRALKKNPRQSPRQLARTISRLVVASFKRSDNVTMTAVAPSTALGDVARTFKALVMRIQAASKHDPERRDLLLALRTATFSEARQYVDFVDLCYRIRRKVRDPLIRQAATEVIQALKSSSPPLLVGHHHKGPRVARFNGLSIYLRSVRASRKHDEDVDAKIGEYRKLAFVADTGWQRFVDRLMT